MVTSRATARPFKGNRMKSPTTTTFDVEISRGSLRFRGAALLSGVEECPECCVSACASFRRVQFTAMQWALHGSALNPQRVFARKRFVLLLVDARSFIALFKESCYLERCRARPHLGSMSCIIAQWMHMTLMRHPQGSTSHSMQLEQIKFIHHHFKGSRF